jgi:tetrahydromethanopterin S-methyltransferase subunit D
MTAIFTGRPWLVGAALMTLTLVSATISEERGLTQISAVGLFIIAAIKAELVLDNFMEAPQAEAHWKWLYRGWIAVITLMLSIGFAV